MKCCCSWGAAVKGEWPEFDCALCPKHGYGELGLHKELCKHHKKMLALWSPAQMGQHCQTCGNFYDRTYVRRQNERICIHCIDLQNRGGGGRGGGRHGADVERPLNQPATSAMHAAPGPCVYCGIDARPKYWWHGQTFSACGWGHAGLFMDAVMDLLIEPEPDYDLRAGEAYVRRSLGIE